MAKKAINNEGIFTAKQNLPGNLKKGDRFEFRGDGYYLIGAGGATGTKCPYDCAKEKEFFSHEKPVMFPKLTEVCNTQKLTLKIMSPGRSFKAVKSTRKRWSGGNIDVPPFSDMVVICQHDIPPQGRSRSSVPGYLVRVTSMQNVEVLCPEAFLSKPQYVYFWNSKGVLCRNIKGANPEMEKFGEKTGNLFSSSEEGHKWLTKIMAWRKELGKGVPA